MLAKRKNVKANRNYSFPPTKLRNVFCTQCKHQFFLQEFVPLQGLVPLLLNCGHVICNNCVKSFANKPCSVCNMISQCEDSQTASLPLNMYALGLTVMSHNRPVNIDDLDISFSKSPTVKSKQHCMKGLCHECGIEAAIKCPQCSALYCSICYSKIHGRALQNHSKVILSDGNDKNSFTIQNTCSERCSEPLGYYCDNCDIAGCSHCMLRLHKKHNYQSLLQKNESLLLKFQSMLEQVQGNLRRVQQAQKKLKTVASCPEDTHNVDSVEATITQHFAHLHGVLQNAEKKIIDSLQEHRSSRNKNIDEIRTQLNGHESQLQSAVMVTESISKNLDKINIQRVIEKLQSLIDIPCYLIENTAPDDEEISLNIDRSIVETIEKHCSIGVPKASSFSLERKKFLPEDYEIEPLVDEVTVSNCKDKSMEMASTSMTTSHSPTKNDNLPDVGSTTTINVSHVVDPSCFYVQLTQNRQKLVELFAGLTILGSTSESVPKEVTLNALYMVRYSKDKTWYRARVTNKKVGARGVEKYNVLFIDYGMKEENVPLLRIRNIAPQYAILPVMALRCTLYDVVPNNGIWHPDATQCFKKLVSTNAVTSMRIILITGDIYYVDLCVISSKDGRLISVKDSLTYMSYATCVSQNKLMRTNPESTRTYCKEQLEMETFKDVEILSIESPSCIYVRKARGNRSYFVKMIKELTEDYQENETATELFLAPHKDMPCAARWIDGCWHRALICEVTENTVKVFFVDLGHTLILNHDDVRVLSKKYLSCNTQAIRVSLKNVKPPSGDKDQWEPEATDCLQKFLLQQRNVRIIPFSKLGDTYSVVMYMDKINVATLLITHGLAQSTGTNTYIPYNTSTNNNRFKNQKHRNRRNIKDAPELPCGVPYDNASIKNKSMEENEDPFKICVMVHQVLSPDCIYVSDATCDQPDVEQMMKQMQEFYNKYRSEKQEVWNKNDTCAIYSTRSDMYYRARIVDIKSPDKVIVFLYDIGTEEIVSIDDIQTLYPMYSKISTYVFKIKLTGILPCGGSNVWPSLSCEKLQQIINNNQNCKFYISKVDEEDVEDSVIPVELWIKVVKMDGPLDPTRYEISSVNRMLVEEGLALPIKEYAKRRDKILAIELKRQLTKKMGRLAQCESNVKWFEIKNDVNEFAQANCNKGIPKMVLQNTDTDSDSEIYNSDESFHNIPLLPLSSAWLPPTPILEDTFVAIPTNLDHNGFLYLHSKTQNSEILQYIEMELEKLYNERPIESCDTVWAAGDMCIAQYHANKKWYRGTVLKVQENDIIEVQFVDYGNIEECSIGTLKKKVVLESIPIQCTKCAIYGLLPDPESGVWRIEDLDRIHSLLVEHECEVIVKDRLDTHLVISLTILPNNYCNTKCDLISFLINTWKMNISPNTEDTLLERSVSTPDSPDVLIENTRPFCSDDEIIKDAVISGNSASLACKNNSNTNDSGTITDIENLSWCKIQSEVISSTPYVVSEENLLMNYKVIDIPEDLQYIEIELCWNISPTEFYAQLKENAHSEVLNMYHVQYERLMGDLQESAYKQPMMTNFAPNTPCCAKFEDDLWYRCVIMESESITNSDDVEIKLLYIDYGNSECRIVNSQQCDLYTLKKEWLDVPAMAIKCDLWNIELAPAVTYSTLRSQLSKMYNICVIATIKDSNKEVVSVELYEDSERKKLLYNSLIEQGLFIFKAESN